jgi:hypothetical protein
MADGAESHAVSESWWLPLWEFFVHTTIGTGIFLVITAPAVGLNLLVKHLATYGTDWYIIFGLTVAEYCLFLVDILLYLAFLGRTGWETYQKL